MIVLSTIKKQIEQYPNMYKTCCHKMRPGHVCHGNIQLEHPWARACGGDSKRLHPVVVPVCSSCNYSPDRETKSWSKLMAYGYYGIEQLQNLCSKKDWISDKKLSESFFT